MSNIPPGPVLLVQLPVPHLVPEHVTANIPMAAAVLKLYASRQGRAVRTVTMLDPLVQNRGGDHRMIDAIIAARPALIGFTCTVWNIERTLYICRNIRAALPETRIILGGPEIAADNPAVCAADAPFDWAVEGEGEHAMALIADGADPDTLDGLLLPGGNRTAGKHAIGTLDTLDDVADPFEEGLVACEADNVAPVEFYRGCSYGCSFCRYHQGRSAGRHAVRSHAAITRFFAWARKAGVQELYILDPSLEQRRDLESFLALLTAVNRSPVIPLSVELRADRIDEALARKLHAAGVRHAETGLQTVTPAALALMHRRFDPPAFERGITGLRNCGIRITTDVMIGLPADTPAGFRATLDFVNSLGLAPATQVFRTQVLPGTELRARAAELDVTFQSAPPYFITRTPSWPDGSIAAAAEEAIDILGVTNDPEHRPCIAPGAGRGRPYAKEHFDTGGPAWFIAADLSLPGGLAALGRESFDDTAAAASLWLRGFEPYRDLDIVRSAAARLAAANPYAGLSIILEAAPGAPLNVFDAVHEFLLAGERSRYVEGMHTLPAVPCVQRRLFAALNHADAAGMNPDWLADLRMVSGIIWIVPAADTDRAAAAVSRLPAGADDYIFIDMDLPGDPEARSAAFDCLAFLEDKAHRLLLPALEPHWTFIRRLEAREKQDT